LRKGYSDKDSKIKLPIDLCVVGGGLAGLSCALRARFIKTYGAYPMSVALFEASPRAGGLANLGNIKLTGPQFNLPGAEIVSKLNADIDFYDIPIINETVVSITKNDGSGLFEIETNGPAGKNKYLSRTVCLCGGMRRLRNEWEFFGRGVKITYMGYDKIRDMIYKSITENAAGDYLIYGNEYSKNLINFVKSALTDKNGRIFSERPIFLIDSDESSFRKEKTYKMYPWLFEFGKIVKYEGSSQLKNIKVLTGGKIIDRPVKELLLDYNAFEIKPDFEIKIAMPDNTPKIFLKKGFIKVDREMRTRIKRLFAAGDITGLYFCASRAISEGIIAAFSAYKEVMKYKNIKNQSVFAYSPLNKTYEFDYQEIPDFDVSKEIIVLSREKAVSEFLEKYDGLELTGEKINEILKYFGFYNVLGNEDFFKIQKILEIDEKSFRRLLAEMIKAKLITIY